MSPRRKILIVFLLLLVVAMLVPVIHHYRLRAAVNAYIAELKAKGEPMDLAQVIPPPVPPEQNGASNFLKAASLLNTNWNVIGSNQPPAMRMVAPGKAMIGWAQPDIRSSDATNTWNELGAELSDADNDLIELRGLVKHPLLDFNLNYSRGWSVPLPHLLKFRRAAQWLDASALHNLHQGQSANACIDVRAMLAIVKGEAEERTTVSQLVRDSVASMSVNTTWAILQDPKTSDNDLARLQQDWQSLEFIGPCERALWWERVAALLTFDQLRQSDFKKMFVPFQGKWQETRWDWFWSYKDEALGLQAFQVVIDSARMAQTNNSFQLLQSFAHTNFVRLGLEKENGETQMTNDSDLNDEAHVMLTQSAYDSFAALHKTVKMEIGRNVVVTAVALRRYELRHHRLPAVLGELIPEFLKSIPTDCMDGQPLRYRPKPDGTFLLYSVGENGKDDGGDPSLEPGVKSSSFYWQGPYALDWVWPQPATPEEIRAYYARQKSRN